MLVVVFSVLYFLVSYFILKIFKDILLLLLFYRWEIGSKLLVDIIFELKRSGVNIGIG